MATKIPQSAAITRAFAAHGLVPMHVGDGTLAYAGRVGPPARGLWLVVATDRGRLPRRMSTPVVSELAPGPAGRPILQHRFASTGAFLKSLFVYGRPVR
jgi:hypothetical protein